MLATRRQRAAGLALSASFLVLFLHSLFYSGFFEDPITWGILATAAALLAEPVPAVETVAAGKARLGRAAKRIGGPAAAEDIRPSS
jgi:hypothetical protein